MRATASIEKTQTYIPQEEMEEEEEKKLNKRYIRLIWFHINTNLYFDLQALLICCFSFLLNERYQNPRKIRALEWMENQSSWEKKKKKMTRKWRVCISNFITNWHIYFLALSMISWYIFQGYMASKSMIMLYYKIQTSIKCFFLCKGMDCMTVFSCMMPLERYWHYKRPKLLWLFSNQLDIQLKMITNDNKIIFVGKEVHFLQFKFNLNNVYLSL